LQYYLETLEKIHQNADTKHQTEKSNTENIAYFYFLHEEVKGGGETVEGLANRSPKS